MSRDRNGIRLINDRPKQLKFDERACDPRTLKRSKLGIRVRSRMKKKEAMELAIHFRARLNEFGWRSKIYPSRTSNSIYVISIRRSTQIRTIISDHTQPEHVKQLPTITNKATCKKRVQWISENYK